MVIKHINNVIEKPLMKSVKNVTDPRNMIRNPRIMVTEPRHMIRNPRIMVKKPNHNVEKPAKRTKEEPGESVKRKIKDVVIKHINNVIEKPLDDTIINVKKPRKVGPEIIKRTKNSLDSKD